MSVKNVRTSAGSVLLVSPTRPVTYDAAGFQSLAWTEVAEITDLGEFGREYSQVTHAPLGTRRTIKRRGGFNVTVQKADGKKLFQFGERGTTQ